MKLKTKIWIAVGVIAALLIAQMWWRPSESRLQDGDIVFRGTNPALLGLTLSPWTHCGVLHKENGQWMVYEAIGTQHKKISLKKIEKARSALHFSSNAPEKSTHRCTKEQNHKSCFAFSWPKIRPLLQLDRSGSILFRTGLERLQSRWHRTV